MNKTQLLIASALTSMIAAGLAPSAQAADQKPATEKCGGIAKAGKNDCGNAKHACAGQASKDGEKDEYLHLPAGACEKIAGGVVIAKKN